ncbi:hypothetical protein CYMTET_21142 [Cymbomonas tetramitiformis]|uniref:Uncharacterized protein n=1 Tax=Cymbomonas tetramitiformis TaxID=36881 RepID=A0AAE0G2X2_9CHLO|nr:hypothetical protein CYMTET_21142 [Cymbomonas tetramitiformis]
MNTLISFAASAANAEETVVWDWARERHPSGLEHVSDFEPSLGSATLTLRDVLGDTTGGLDMTPTSNEFSM